MANRYWVGGTNTWDGIAGTKWALTSGGAGGQAVPTSADDVFFSNLSTGTCTISTGNTGAKSINCTGFTGTIAGTAAITVSGSVTLVAGMTYTRTGALTINATSTITSAGKTFGDITVNTIGGTVTLADALTISPTNSTILQAGTIALNGFTLSTGVFNSDGFGGARAVAFGSGNIALTSTTASTIVLRLAGANNFTWTGTGGFTRNMAATATVQFGTAATGTVLNAPNLTVNAGASTLTITGNSWWKNLNFTGSTCTVSGTGQNFAGSITLGGGTYTTFGGTFFASGTITCAGKTLGSTTAGASITVNGAGITVNLADAYSGSNFTLTQGTFTTNNFNVTLTGGFLATNSNTRALNMGSSTFTVGGVNFSVATSTGMTLNAGTSTITMTNASAKNFLGGGLTYYNLNQGGAGTLTISGSNTFNNITNSTQPATVTFTAGTTQTVSAFGLSGTAGNLITINSTTPGSQFTLSDASGVINAQYLAIQDSNATGGAVWNSLLTNGNVNNGNNTGWIFFPPGNMFLMFI